MSTINLIDLSLVKNQNELAIKIANFFTRDEFRIIDLTKLHKSENRGIDEIEYLHYYKKLSTDKELKIIDMLLLDASPVSRYIIIRLINGPEQLDFKCYYAKNMVKLLNSLFIRAYNYKCWKSDGDEKIIKSKIINNFSNKLSSELTKEELEEIKFVITYLTDQGKIKNDTDFNYDFCIGKYEFNIESNDAGLIRFSYKVKKDPYFNSIYFTTTETGLANINLIIEEALNNNR
jgi:hypothetical protein